MASFFIVFVKSLKNREKCLLVNTFQRFWTIEHHWFSDCLFRDFHVFSKPFPGTVLGGGRTFIKRFLIPFNIFWVFKKTPLDNSGSQKLQNSSTPVEGERPFRDPAFHESTVITAPLGHRDFLTYTFSMEIGSFSVFGAFLYAMFYTKCLSLVFKKNISKRLAVEPSVF